MPFRITWFDVGLIILSLSLVTFIFANVGTFGESWRLVVILEAHPQFYLNYLQRILLCGILPTATGLAICIVGCVKERKSSTGSFYDWFLLILGGFFVFWGALHLQRTLIDYYETIEYTQHYNVGYINGFLLAIYAAYSLVGILWLSADIFFTFTSMYKMLHKPRKLINTACALTNFTKQKKGVYKGTTTLNRN
ncbi:MAG: hypothetical protein U9O89_00165 [Thermoproteota archaeon]|nr:hypothetical protein [Thermoproteota archaeon]